jgi:hypothetical protein
MYALEGSHRMQESAVAVEPGRTNVMTVSPRSRKDDTRALPMRPEAPVTPTRTTRPSVLQ